MFCARVCRGRAVEKFKILICVLFRVSNVIARKACEAIDVQRRVVFFSLRANVYTGIRGVVLVVVVVFCAIFYLSKKSFCARVEFLSSSLLLLFLGTTTVSYTHLTLPTILCV